MGFLNIFSLSYLGLILFVVFIYFYNKKSNIVYVSSLIPWKELKTDVVSSRLFRIDFLFLLQIFLIILLSIFLARPYTSKDISIFHGHNKVVVIDTSASMQTKEKDATRFENAKKKLLELVDEMKSVDKMMIISAYSSSEVIINLEKNKKKLKEKIENLTPTETGTDMEGAISFALSYIENIKNPQFYILTDQRLEDCGTKVSNLNPENIEIFRFADKASNVSIEALNIFQDLFNKNDEAYITLKNSKEKANKVNLKTYLNDKQIMETNVSMKPGEQKTITVKDITSFGILKTEIITDDALKVDNVVYGIVKERKKVIKILFVTDSVSFTEDFKKLEEAFQQVEIKALPTKLYVSDIYKDYDIFIFHKFVPQIIPKINSIFISPVAINNLTTEMLTGSLISTSKIRDIFNKEKNSMSWKSFLLPSGIISNVTILDWANTHPTMKYLNYLDNIKIDDALLFTPPKNSKILAIASGLVSEFPDPTSSPNFRNDIPLLYSTKLGNTRSIVMGIDLEQFSFSETNNLPLLIMMINMIQWLSPLGEYLDSSDMSDTSLDFQMKTGDVFTPADRVNFKELSSVNSNGESISLLKNSEKLNDSTENENDIYDRTNITIKKTGVYLVKGKNHNRVFVANMFNEKESNIEFLKSSIASKEDKTELQNLKEDGLESLSTTKKEINELARYILYLIPIIMILEWGYSFFKK